LEPWTRERREIRKGVLLWIATALFAVLIRTALGRIYGTFPYSMSFDLANILSNIPKLFEFVFLLQFFHSTIRPAAVLEIAALLMLLASIARQNRRAWSMAGVAVALAAFSGAHMLVMTYEAPRSIFGAAFLKTIFIAVAASAAVRSGRPRLA